MPQNQREQKKINKRASRKAYQPNIEECWHRGGTAMLVRTRNEGNRKCPENLTIYKSL